MLRARSGSRSVERRYCPGIDVITSRRSRPGCTNTGYMSRPGTRSVSLTRERRAGVARRRRSRDSGKLMTAIEWQRGSMEELRNDGHEGREYEYRDQDEAHEQKHRISSSAGSQSAPQGFGRVNV